MDIQIDTQITDILEKYCKKFYSAILDQDQDFYLKYKTMDENDRFNNFIYTIIADNDSFVRYYAILIDKGCDKTELNRFFYLYMKMKQKSEEKLWSWNELESFNIDDPDVKTTLKYKFF